MKQFLGIDIGSTASSVVVIDSGCKVLFRDYRFHAGRIISTLRDQLEKIPEGIISGIACTSSTPEILSSRIKIDSRLAYLRAAHQVYPNPEAMLIIGGEKFGLLKFDENHRYKNYKSNTSCAAGTGSFLDQQVKRLNLESISQLSDLANQNRSKYPKIASRCSVFAKTDLIHAQQEGYSLGAICEGLCYGLAKNLADAVINEVNFKTLIVAGGVSLNKGVLKHIKAITGAELLIHEYSHLFGAFGAAISLMNENPMPGIPSGSICDIISQEKKAKNYSNPSLSLRLSKYPDFKGFQDYPFKSRKFPGIKPVEVTIYKKLRKKSRFDVYLGIDIGSTSTKAVILNQKKEVLAGLYTRTSGQPLRAVQSIFEALDDLQQKNSIRFQVNAAGTTGSGRKFIARIINADTEPDEITAHARAAVELDPETDTIIEIGGQDSKFTVLDNGIVCLSIMNNVCAAGTGSFIEEQALKLDCPLEDYPDRAMKCGSPLASDRCTVFMERDLNHFLNEGYEKDELLASVLHSIRENYLSKVAIPAHIGNKIFFQGATAKNKALVASFEQKLNKPIMVSKYCHLTGALGVALDLHDKNIRESGFRGIGIWKKEIPVRTELCELCTNHCKLKIAEIDNVIEAYGFLCGRDYHTEKFVKHIKGGFDLVNSYKKQFHFSPRAFGSGILIGLPNALHMAEDMPFWKKFFDLLNIKTLGSENYTDAVKVGKKIAEAEFCAPVSAAFGHVNYLKDKVSHIFLPVYLENGNGIANSKQYCYYTQYISSLIKNTPSLFGKNGILDPLIHSLKPESYTISELERVLHQAGLKDLSTRQIYHAYRDARQFIAQKQLGWKQIFEEKKDQSDINIVLLGRPYILFNSSMNNHIPGIISKFGCPAFYMDMLPGSLLNGKNNSAIVKTIIWKYAAKILHSAEYIAASSNLYPVLITSFKCTPDSFVIEYFKEIMNAAKKPFLILQLDEHDSTVGYETRIEAAIRSFRNHYQSRHTKKPARFHIKEVVGIENSNLKTELNSFLSDHELDPAELFGTHPDLQMDFDLSKLRTGETHKLRDKTILLPGWDRYAGQLIKAFLQKEGWDVEVISDTRDSIRRSLNLNSGQCLPLNAIAQNTCDYIEKHDVNPSEIVLWVPRGLLSCNLPMFPHYVKKILKKYNERYADVQVYPGNMGFYDFSVRTGMNVFLAFLFAGSIRKIVCKTRPYELEKGATDRVSDEAVQSLCNAIVKGSPKGPALEKIMAGFKEIEIKKTLRPKVAIFGDIYVRDNGVFNQDLDKIIEDNGGEVIPTSYSEYIKIIIKQLELRYIEEGRYLEGYYLRYLKYLIPMLEMKYQKYFENYIKNINPLNGELFDLLHKHNLHLLHRGESVENLLKIENLIRNYDISLFVQTSPSYCCPSLVTEAMSSHIERTTGIPVVSIEYDGTYGGKNEDVIPYLKNR